MVAESIVSVQLYLIITIEKAEVNWEFPAEWRPLCRFSRRLVQRTKVRCVSGSLRLIFQARAGCSEGLNWHNSYSSDASFLSRNSIFLKLTCLFLKKTQQTPSEKKQYSFSSQNYCTRNLPASSSCNPTLLPEVPFSKHQHLSRCNSQRRGRRWFAFEEHDAPAPRLKYHPSRGTAHQIQLVLFSQVILPAFMMLGAGGAGCCANRCGVSGYLCVEMAL